MVDDCTAFESLVHRMLGDYRQRGREFFYIAAADAYLQIRQILAGQDRIKEIPITAAPQQSQPLPRYTPSRPARRPVNPNPLLQAFAAKFQIEARSFGQAGKQSFGASDGAEGVQWNLGIKHENGDAFLGVNLGPVFS
jgi:hypothetical protein